MISEREMSRETQSRHAEGMGASRMPSWAGDVLIALALGAVALALRLAFLGKDSLWGDEFDTWFVATQPTLSALLRHVVAYEPHPPLYFMLVREFLALAGGSDDFMLRLPSALAGALTVPVFYGLARLLWPGRRAAAALAGALLAVSPMHLYYSQEARAYAIQVLFETSALAAFALAWRGLADRERPGAGWAAGAWLCTAGLLATLALEVQYYSAFIWLALLGLIGWTGWRQARHAPGRWVPALALLGLGMLHPAWSVIHRFMVGWGKAFSSFLPERYGPDLLFHVARAQLLGPLWSPLPMWAQVAGLGAGLSLLGLGAYDLWRTRQSQPAPAMMALLGGVFTLGLPVAISFVKPIIFWGQRYLVIAQPFVLLVLAVGVALPVRRLLPVRVALLGVLLACQGGYLYNHYAHRTKHCWDVVGEDLTRTSGSRTIYVLPDRAAGLLGRYMPQGSRIVGTNDPREAAQGGGAGAVYVISYMDPRPWLQRAGMTGKMTTRVYEAYRPGQEIWVVEAGGQTSDGKKENR